MKPVELMQKHLPAIVEIIATHPLFGPQSAKDSIEGRLMVVYPVRTTQFDGVKIFLSDTLKLKVLEKTPEEHDRAMAYVQALTHLIGRSVAEMNILDSDMKTMAYEHLLNIKELVGHDSLELFKTIQNENPFAAKICKDFVESIKTCETLL
jgi:prephenate dehydrogenase